MKKIFLTLLVAALLVLSLSIFVSAADVEVTFGDVTYKFGEVTTLDSIEIPEGYDAESRVLMSDGKTYPSYYIFGKANHIGKNSLVWDKIAKDDGSAYTIADVIMLEVPSYITELRNDAPLSDMDNVVYVSIPSIKTIQNEAHFSGLDSLVVANLSRATGMTYMSRGFFMNNANLTTVIWPETSSFTSIGRGAFANCTSLTEIALPEGIKSIGEDGHNNPGTFQGCTNLKSVHLPNSLTFIGKKDFLNCSSLTSSCSFGMLLYKFYKHCLEFQCL